MHDPPIIGAGTGYTPHSYTRTFRDYTVNMITMNVHDYTHI